MSRQPVRETEQLTQVIRAIQRTRRSGMLEVQRSVGASLIEAGTIVFVKGSIVDAHVGRTQGKDASNVLSQWTRCSFAFSSSNPQDPPLDLPFSTISTQMEPASNGQQLVAGFDKFPLRQEPAASRMNDSSPPDSDPMLTTLLTAMPVHLQKPEMSIRVIERLNYPRAYRQLCLLIDGHHSIADLSRLLGRSPMEVVKMLSDLERAQCIRVPRK